MNNFEIIKRDGIIPCLGHDLSAGTTCNLCKFCLRYISEETEEWEANPFLDRMIINIFHEDGIYKESCSKYLYWDK